MMPISLPLPVKHRLKAFIKEVQVIEHEPVHTCRQVNEVLRVPLDFIAKGVLWGGVRLTEPFFTLTVVPANKRVSPSRVREYAGTKNLVMATDVETLTGYPAGSIPPFALPQGISILIDEALATGETVWFGSGVPTISFVAAGWVLVALARATVAHLTE